jgi:hypothetical protein
MINENNIENKKEQIPYCIASGTIVEKKGKICLVRLDGFPHSFNVSSVFNENNEKNEFSIGDYIQGIIREDRNITLMKDVHKV